MDTPHEVAALTGAERAIDARFRMALAKLPQHGIVGWLVECGVFVLKQAWACVFGGAMLAAIFAAHVWYPDRSALARNDVLTLAAVAIQIAMVVARLESMRELRVVILFHLVGTVMELFKTHIGSWSYEDDGVLRVGAVPLFSGFMYAAVGSYMVRVNRLFDLRFARYPRLWLTVVVAAAGYANFFTNHYILDLRWLLLLAVALVFGRCVMQFRIHRRRLRMPLLLAFLLVAGVIWVAENIATWSQAWLYPSQLDGWTLVSPTKLTSWFLLMIISVVMVTWISPPQPPDVGELVRKGSSVQRLSSADQCDSGGGVKVRSRYDTKQADGGPPDNGHASH